MPYAWSGVRPGEPDLHQGPVLLAGRVIGSVLAYRLGAVAAPHPHAVALRPHAVAQGTDPWVLRSCLLPEKIHVHGCTS